MNRRGILRSAFVAAAAALGAGRFAAPARAQTRHIRLYVEMDVPPGREREVHVVQHDVSTERLVEAPRLEDGRRSSRDRVPGGHGSGPPATPADRGVSPARASCAAAVSWNSAGWRRRRARPRMPSGM